MYGLPYTLHALHQRYMYLRGLLEPPDRYPPIIGPQYMDRVYGPRYVCVVMFTASEYVGKTSLEKIRMQDTLWSLLRAPCPPLSAERLTSPHPFPFSLEGGSWGNVDRFGVCWIPQLYMFPALDGQSLVIQSGPVGPACAGC